jgi:glyoxylase-like metal-dependent hydrolase (beta-lactamase superfamily II)
MSERSAARLGTIAAALILAHGTHAAAQSNGAFHVDTLAPNVYAVVRHDPLSYVNNANSLVVVGDSGVLVVDAQFTRQATNETLGAIRRITAMPVRYLVNTHWHDDHVAGNQVYVDSFPAVRIIAHANTREDLIALGAPNRRATWDAAAPFASRFERLLSFGLGGDSTAAVPRERAAMENTILVGRQYLTEKAGFRETLPNVTFRRTTTVDLGRQRVEIHYFGNANTRGDAVVYVPAARVAATGDIVVAPVPLAFNAYVSGWIGALDSILARKPLVILPGHGAPMRDDRYVHQMRRMLVRIRDEARRAHATGLSLADTRQRITLADEREAIAHGDKWLNAIFSSFFLGPAIARAYAGDSS